MDNLLTSVKLKQKPLFLLILISAIVLYFIFAPALNTLYYSGEDLRYVFGGYNKSCSQDDGFYFVLTLGRPLQAYMDCLSYKFAYSVEHMRIVRLFAVLLMGCGMGLLADWLISLGFAAWSALLTAGCLFLLPKLYGDTIALGAISLPFAVLFVLLAYRSLSRFHSIYSSHPTWIIPTQKKEITSLLLAGFFILCALLTYPAMTFCFGALILMKLLFSNLENWPNTRREIIIEVFLFGGICTLYFIYAYLNMEFNAYSPVPDAYRIDHPNFNLLELLTRALPLGNVFNGAWLFLPSVPIKLQGSLLLILLVSAGILGMREWVNSPLYTQSLSFLLQAILAAAILILLSSSFFLIMPARDSLTSRLVFASMAANLALLIWCFMRWGTFLSTAHKNNNTKTQKKYAGILIALFFLIQGYQANLYTMTDALSYARFMNTIITQISDYITKGNSLARIHFVIPKEEYPYTRFFIANGALATLFGHENYQLEWCSLPRGVLGDDKANQAFGVKCMKELKNGVIAVTFSYLNEPYVKTKGMLLIEKQFERIKL